MSSRLSSNVGRIINFPRRGKNDEATMQMLKVALPIVAGVAWQLLQRREQARRGPAGAAKEMAGRAQEAMKATSGAANTARRKARRSARYYAISAPIVAIEHPTSRKLLISALKLLRNVL